MVENEIGGNGSQEEPKYERSGINTSAILKIGGLTIIAAAVIYLLTWLAFMYFDNRETSLGKLQEPAPSVSLREKLPPEPRLQSSPNLDLTQMREKENRELNSYNWIDRDKGTVSIPIDRAIDL